MKNLILFLYGAQLRMIRFHFHKDPDGNNVWNESLNPDDEKKISTLIITGIGGWQKWKLFGCILNR